VSAAASANGHSEVFDLTDAADAAAGEGEPFPFTFKGKPYSVPPATSWPVSALRAVSRGDLDSALAELVGAETFDALCDDGLRLGQLNVLFGKIATAQGLGDLKNSARQQRPVSTRTSKRR
jgi:hypothetical protein